MDQATMARLSFVAREPAGAHSATSASSAPVHATLERCRGANHDHSAKI
jgi:hypothetical protein